MHLGRFNTAVRELQEYYQKLTFGEKLTEAISLLQQYASNKDPNVLNTFRTRLHDLALSAELVPSLFLLPSVIELFDDLSVTEWQGSSLGMRLRAALSSQAMLTEEIITALTELRDKYAAVVADISNIASSLKNRNVEALTLQGAAAEFGVAFPRELVGETAGDLINEFEHVNRLFMALNDFLGRGVESPKVRTIASSWWQIFIELDAAQIALWTVAIERIVAMLKMNYEIKKLQKDLEEKKDLVPAHFITELEEKLISNLRIGVAGLASELRKLSNPQGDVANLNETEVRLKLELLHLVRRVSGGAVLELRLAPPDNDAIDTGPIPETEEERIAFMEKVHDHQQLNAKLADLSNATARIELREDLKLEGPGSE